MSKTLDLSIVVRIVDNWKERCPGEVNGRVLTQIGVQKERRWIKRLFKRVKHVIYLQEGTKNIWYKNSKCALGVVAMGFSLKRLENHPNAVPMEFYYGVFTDPGGLVSLKHLSARQQDMLKDLLLTGNDWLKMNNYEVTPR